MAHNKKRNTAFLYEVLLREGTKSALEKNVEKIMLVKNIILEHFHPNSNLYKELQLYRALLDNKVEEQYAEKYLKEVEYRYEKIDKKAIFNEQSKLINTINKKIGTKAYNSFIPNYKDLATIAQIFNSTTPVKEKILLEQSIVDKIKVISESAQQEMKSIDNILFKTFNKKFNDKYSSLLNEQKELLSKYVMSFENNGVELKIYLNEEVERLKTLVKESLKKDEIANSQELVQKTQNALNYLNNFNQIKELSQDNLKKILKIQQFVHEVEK